MLDNVFIIIQARMTSTRLPGKVLLPLCNKTVLETMILRLNPFIKNIIIATTDDGTEKPIVDLCKGINIKYYQGSTDNVLQRYFLAAKKFNLKDDDIIVRLTSDCPLYDVNILKNMVEVFLKLKCDFMSNAINRKFPRGMDTAMFRYYNLKRVYESVVTEDEKEHMTLYFHKNKDKFIVNSYENEIDHSMYRLTLDEKEDYELIKEIYQKFDCKTDFIYEELIDTLERNPYLSKINAHIEQKEV